MRCFLSLDAMGRKGIFLELRMVVAFLLAVPLEAVTVNPSLCPTNKIAPHKRNIANWQYGSGRTFGAFYDLLTPGNPQFDAPNDQNDLQEQPQEDDPSDCGEIEDYDENDLSAITQQGNRRRDSRGFFSLFRPPQTYPQRPPNFPPPPNFPSPAFPQRPPPNIPQRPQGPSFPARRPYWSGGLFGSNDYRPPLLQHPSDFLKPIHEYSENSQATYRPSVVGGPLGHVVGVSPIIPTTSEDEPTTARTFFNRLRTSTQSPNMYPTRRPRPRNINNNGIFGSFVDLLF